MKTVCLNVTLAVCLGSVAGTIVGAEPAPAEPAVGPLPFGSGGQVNMLYDRRQRPQCVFVDNKLHIVFKGGGKTRSQSKSRTQPMAITYDPRTRKFSEVVILGKASSDHHHCPVIWVDSDHYLHVLLGCHKTPGSHLISRQPGRIGSDLTAWKRAPQIAASMSYPTVFRIHKNRELIYFRTGGHSSSWTYRISSDLGKSWTGPEKDVTDMDSQGRTEWSSYQCKLPSQDGKYLHVVFTAYDDVKSNDPKRLYNPRYKKPVRNEWKYNLYYLKIDLQTQAVVNCDGQRMRTPIDIDQADAKCRIWDTEWRGAGVPPSIALDEHGGPTFLHVLSGDTLEDHHYYYVRRDNGEWKHTRITRSSHQWNSCHIRRNRGGRLHAYLITGDKYLDTGGYNDKHGGGTVEEWVSSDKGNTWKKARDLTPDRSQYPDWRYNNIQPVTRADGRIVDGMLLFYGWKDKNAPDARAFLLHEPDGKKSG